jgi:hypothetical protein
MGSVKTLNPNADVMGRHAATFMCVNAAKGLHEVSCGSRINAMGLLLQQPGSRAGSAP